MKCQREKIYYSSNKWIVLLFVIILFFFVFHTGNTQTTESDFIINNWMNNWFTENEIQYLIIEVLFSDYNENAIHFSFADGGGGWNDTVQMMIISGEYENQILKILIGEYPARSQFKNSNKYIIKIDKTRLEEYLLNRNLFFSSSYIVFIEY